VPSVGHVKDNPKWRKESGKEMNKKLIFLLIPLLLMPMVAFAYAHWYDSVTKTIKMHVGTVDVEIVRWHVDRTSTYDADCDGVIQGDELQITPIEVTEGVPPQLQVEGVQILVDPIYPSWFLEFKFIVHNKGRLVLHMSERSGWGWGGPYVDDPTWEPIPLTGTVPPGFQYNTYLYLHDPAITGCPRPCLDFTHYTDRRDPTTFNLKPSESVMVYQYIHFLGQEFPEYQCHWFKLYYVLEFLEWTGPEWGSYGWP